MRDAVSKMSAEAGPAFADRVRYFRTHYPRGGALFFTRRVNRTGGSILSVLLFPTPVTPNQVSVAGLAVHIVAVLIVGMAGASISIATALVVLLLWQLAFSLDCADGQLARARNTPSRFGAWLDVSIDVLSHVLVYGVLAIHVARALRLDGMTASAFTTIVLGLHLFQLFTSWERGILGSDPAVAHPSPVLGVAMGARHLLDYGWFLFAAGILLVWPHALAWFLLASAGLHAAAALIQLALNWRNHIADGRDGPGGVDRA